MPTLTSVMPIQQHRPMKMGLPPVLTSLTTSVLKPIAAMAMTMKNLERVLMGAVTATGRANTVVMTLAKTKKRMKNGKIFLMSNVPVAAPSPVPVSAARFACRTCQKARNSVMGIIASVRVS